jgi:hypothetical protein
MPSRNAAVAEGVKARLNVAANGGGLSKQFTARRVYDVTVEARDLAELSVTVALATDESEFLSRGVDQHTIKVQIGIRQQLPQGVDPADESANELWLDDMVAFSESVADLFRPDALPGTDAQCTDAAIGPIADPTHLRENRVFFSVITLTFFVPV